jgi:hypothetical protein
MGRECTLADRSSCLVQQKPKPRLVIAPTDFTNQSDYSGVLVYVSEGKSISCSLVERRRHHGKMSNMQTRVKFQFILDARIITTVNSHLSNFITFQPNDVFKTKVPWNTPSAF